MDFKKAIFGVTASVMLALTACGDSAPNGGNNEDEAAGGGTVQVGVSSMPPGLGDPFSGVGAQSIYTWSAVFDPLVLVDNDGVPQPWLATEWENIDPHSWEFQLREGVEFSNGEEFTAEAVKATIDFLASDEGQTTPVGAELNMVDGAEVIDDHTVRITTSEPNASLPATLSAVYIIAPEAWSDLGPDGYATEPVGTGPFELDSIDSDGATGTAFSDSWRDPIADEITFTQLGDSSARTQALQSGQLDVAIALAPDQVPELEAANVAVHSSPAPQVMAMAFTQTIEDSDEAINDPLVRRALNHAIDREAISESIMAGLARPATQGATPDTFGYNSDIEGFEYDPEKAESLLAEAGYDDGLSLTATVTVGSFPGDEDIFQAVQNDLSEIGVTLTFETVQFAQWLEQYQQNTWTTDLFNQSWNTAPEGSSLRPAMIFSCMKSNPFVCDESLTPLIESINSEFDTSEREELLFELAEAYAEDPPSLLLLDQVDLNATSEQTSGFEMTTRFIMYENISVE